MNTHEFSVPERFFVSKPRTIMIVEDDPLVRLEVADRLMTAGCKVIEAATADDALEVLHSSTHLDLVMTDVRMPGSLDGLELARRIRQQWPNLKIIVGSGDRISPEELADAFFPKPYDFPAIVACINRLTGTHDDGG